MDLSSATFSKASCTALIAGFLDCAPLQGHAAERLRGVSRQWRELFSQGPQLWRGFYVARWGADTVFPVPPFDPARWRHLYVMRHRGEISPDPMQRPVKRANPFMSKGGGGSYKRTKRYEAIPGSPTPALTAFFSFVRDQRAARHRDGAPRDDMRLMGARWRAMDEDGQAAWTQRAAFDRARHHTEKGEWLVSRRRVARIKEAQLLVLLELVRLAGPHGWRHQSVKSWLQKGAWKTGKKYSATGAIGGAVIERRRNAS